MNVPRSLTALLVTLVAACGSSVLWPSLAAAWQATVVPATTDTIDVAANDERSSAYFVTLAANASFTITLSGASRSAFDVELLIPARAPENGRSARNLPSLVADGAEATPKVLDTSEQAEDPATGLRLERISTMRVAQGSKRFRVVNADAPNRALVVVRTEDGPTDFELDQPTTVPRAVAGMRAWYDASGERAPAGDRERGAVATWGVIIGVGIVIAMVALALWWGIRGRDEARKPKR